MTLANIANLRVIVVDDMLLSRSTAEKFLRQIGVTQVTQATDGSDAWIKLEEAEKSKQPYNLIITDWMMPELDGMGLIKRMKAANWATFPKIILATAESDIAQIAEAVKLGIHAYVRKPLIFETFKESVERAIAREDSK